MDSVALQNRLLRLFERHEVELEADEDWLLTDGDFPAVRADWHEGAAGEPGRLDIDVVLSEERSIEESYAGHGGGESGCRDALEAFAATSLHVLLAACWYVTDDRKLRLEQWPGGLHGWDAFIGPFQLRGAEVEAPAAAIAAVAAAAGRELLAPQMHWLRLFYRHAADGSASIETLLDNRPWPAGDAALASVAWPASAQAYAARCFIVLDLRDY